MADKHSMPGAFILALGKAKSDKEDPGEDKSESSHEDDHSTEMKRSAMGDLIDALHSKDIDGALSAFEDLCQMCSDDYSSDDQ